jgi:hypothetical protein
LSRLEGDDEAGERTAETAGECAGSEGGAFVADGEADREGREDGQRHLQGVGAEGVRQDVVDRENGRENACGSAEDTPV